MALTTQPSSMRKQKSPKAGWLPGLAFALAAAVLALVVKQLVPSMSPLLVAILLGALLANVVVLPEVLQPGIALAGKRLLRIGIVFLGLQLSLRDILGLGAGMIAVVVAIVSVGILATLWVGRLMGMPPMQRLLIGCGFSICGAAAVAAIDGVVDAEEEDVAAAIALVVVFGTLMIPVAPFVGAMVGFDVHQRGLFVGGSIHEVAQVVAAGGIIGGGALATAVLVKLARVLMLAPVIAVIGWRQRRDGSVPAGAEGPPLVPLFVLGFIAAALVRTTGTLPHQALDVASVLQNLLLSAAMFGLGCGVRFATLRKVGGKPVVLGAISTVLVGATAMTGVWLAT